MQANKISFRNYFKDLTSKFTISSLTKQIFNKANPYSKFICCFCEVPQIINIVIFTQLQKQHEIQWILNAMNVQVLALNYMMAANALINDKILKPNVIQYQKQLIKNMRLSLEKMNYKDEKLMNILNNNLLILQNQSAEPYSYENMQQFVGDIKYQNQIVFVEELIRLLYIKPIILCFATYVYILKRLVQYMFQDYFQRRFGNFEENIYNSKRIINNILLLGNFNLISLLTKFMVSYQSKINQLPDDDVIRRKYFNLQNRLIHFSSLQKKDIHGFMQIHFLFDQNDWKQSLNMPLIENNNQLKKSIAEKYLPNQTFLQHGSNLRSKLLDITKNPQSVRLTQRLISDINDSVRFVDQTLKYSIENKLAENEQTSKYLQLKVLLANQGKILVQYHDKQGIDMNQSLQLFQNINAIRQFVLRSESQQSSICISYLSQDQQRLMIAAVDALPYDRTSLQYYYNYDKKKIRKALGQVDDKSIEYYLAYIYHNQGVLQQATNYATSAMQGPKYRFIYYYENMLTDFLKKSNIDEDIIKNIIPKFRVKMAKQMKWTKSIIQINPEWQFHQMLMEFIPKEYYYQKNILSNLMSIFVNNRFPNAYIWNTTNSQEMIMKYNGISVLLELIQQKLKQQLEQDDRMNLMQLLNQTNDQRLRMYLEVEQIALEKNFINKDSIYVKDFVSQDTQSKQKKAQRFNMIKKITQKTKQFNESQENLKSLQAKYDKLVKQKDEDQIQEEKKMMQNMIKQITNFKVKDVQSFEFHQDNKQLFIHLFQNLMFDNSVQDSLKKFFELIKAPQDLKEFARQKYKENIENLKKGNNAFRQNIVNKIKSGKFDQEFAKLLIEYIYSLLKRTKLTQSINEWAVQSNKKTEQIKLIQNNISYIQKKMSIEKNQQQKQTLSNLLVEFNLQKKRREHLNKYYSKRFDTVKEKIKLFISRIFKGYKLQSSDWQQNLSQMKGLKKYIYEQIVNAQPTKFQGNPIDANTLMSKLQNEIYEENQQFMKKQSIYSTELLNIQIQHQQFQKLLKSQEKPDKLLSAARNMYFYSKEITKKKEKQAKNHVKSIKCLLNSHIKQSSFVHLLLTCYEQLIIDVNKKLNGITLIPNSLIAAMNNSNVEISKLTLRSFEESFENMSGCNVNQFLLQEKDKILKMYKELMKEGFPGQQDQMTSEFQKKVYNSHMFRFNPIITAFKQL